jgi:pimeloyl-ACP methyl ester carboxylesterase
VGKAPAAGLVFYPGGKVDPRSYAPAARALALKGFLVVIPPMPLNLAVLAPDRALDVIAANPEVQAWAVGGHSLGGAMAAHFVAGQPEAVDGLALWGAYAGEGDDVSGWAGRVTSISATNDGLSTPAEIDAGKTRLPSSAHSVVVAGGNHAQFGWYGPQEGDGQATISRADQQTQAVSATAELLAAISG